MGQSNSRQFFVSMLKTMLKAREISVSKQKLERFLAFVEETCPWFPEEGTVSLETWAKLGEQIQMVYTLRGLDKVSLDAYSLWTLIRDCLNPEHESRKFETGLKLITPKCSGVPQQVAEHVYDPPIVPGSRKNDNETTALEQDSDSELSPDEEDDLKEQAFEHDKEGWDAFIVTQ